LFPEIAVADTVRADTPYRSARLFFFSGYKVAHELTKRAQLVKVEAPDFIAHITHLSPLRIGYYLRVVKYRSTPSYHLQLSSP
ncbi:TPA: hypothetical protein ACTW31_002955, partial [Klebsiella pneumoniae]